MFPYQLVDFGRSILAVLAFCSNLLFWKESGYFLATAEEKPLLHTWSLSVEEQFYVLFPLLLLVLYKRSRLFLTLLLSILFVLGLVWAELGWRSNMDANFFLMRGRIWELLLGCFLGLYRTTIKSTKISSLYLKFGEAFGLVFILASVFLFSKHTPTPGLTTLIPTCGAGLIILCSNSASLVGRFLSHTFFVSIGLVSYSAYLWHQPLFAYLKLYKEHPSCSEFSILIFLTFILSYLSWKFIEQPFRNRKLISQSSVFVFFITSTILLAGIAHYLTLENGHPQRFSDYTIHRLPDPYKTSVYRKKQFEQFSYLEKFSTQQPKLLIVGDSFAEDLTNMIFENKAFPGYEILTHTIPARCQIYYGKVNVTQFIASEDKNLCSKDSTTRFLRLSEEADVILLASSWRQWAAERIDETIENIPKKKDAVVYVIGKKIFGTAKIGDFNQADADYRKPLGGNYFADFLQIEVSLEKNVKKANYISMHDMICGKNSSTCIVYTPDGALLSEDAHHVTQSGAKYIGELLFSKTTLQKYR